MTEEIDYIEKDIVLKEVINNELKLINDDLPITIILEGRKKYILLNTPKGLVLNKKK